ncbi:MAG TPA: aspartate kinase [Smithellaceae bacterium]|jgi:aspartate kinase|nr:aspartate kinase [Syntrophaceae bacterium]MDX9816117.1 aspartate kinase [Smithellaceae bacterium]MBP8609297.1 aspartate kinase [Syntrophaceae bacterium]HNV64800.1 aspartate kinase [Smithellaceae bacterium]HNZ31234.1 aspartate kinase [Smithellaceae bacterium]
MALVIQKFGGTSVANVEKIKNVARKVIKEKESGNDVVVVLSAMAGETDRLIALANSATESPDEREFDSLISTGEQVTVSLLSIVLISMGYRAKSFLGFQVKVKTDQAYKKARIKYIEAKAIRRELKNGKIVVVAGFQGVDEENNITTLGRGGSDTSAVALAAALKADRCDIYTDVDGVYTTDPNVCGKARRLNKISYDEMLEMAITGAKVLQPRSVEMAKKYNVPVYVKSTFSEGRGTLVTKEDKDMEKEIVSGITYDKDQAKITVVHVPDKPGVAAALFSPLSAKNINVDMIIQNASLEGFTDLTFTVSKKDLKDAQKIVEEAARVIGAKKVQVDAEVAKVSIIGVGMASHSGVAAKMFSTLANEGVNIMMISTSEIKISCVIQRKYTELAVSVLHDAFGLEKEK